ncbi:MAG TPA: carboxypeptidase-like regulatory domain-containing protein [Candidatus Dormibacteraeota bacterium]|nr:carboxypeptidase-like regulatory domain-containing protein [Candidatus Dormibacteraeota bacterium]
MKTWPRIFWIAVTLSFFAAFANAQDAKREAQLRTVRGVVIDKSDAPISGAVVFLKNTRTNAVRSYIADETGSYRFSGLDPNADYEVHAEKDGAKSPTRTISSFDSRKDIVLNLKIDLKKS